MPPEPTPSDPSHAENHDGETATKPGPANPHTEEGADAATPPGGPLRQDSAGSPEENQAPTTGGDDAVHDDQPGGSSSAQDSENPDERPDVASAPEPGQATSGAAEENAESSAQEPSGSTG